jgi:SAM-dependent methyltransferase
VSASEWDERYRSADRLWSVTPNMYVFDRLRDQTPGSGVDLAAGEGRNAIWLASLGWEMTAVDFSAVALERGSVQAPDVTWIEADVLTWEPQSTFDLVLIAYLHLVPDQFRNVVDRSARLLSAGGELFMIGHDRSNIEHGWGGPQYPEILWDVDETMGWLNELDLLESVVVRRPVETGQGVEYARDALIRGRKPIG